MEKLVEIWKRLDARRRRLLLIYAQALVRGPEKP